MRFSDLIKMGLRNLFRRKARTSLTVIGVIIGTISIVIMISIGTGMNESFEKSVMQNGSMTIITVSTWADVFDDDGNYVSSSTQKLDETLVENLKKLEHVVAVGAKIDKSLTLTCGKYQTWAQITALDCSTYEGFGFPELASGTYPTPENNSTLVLSSNIMNREFNNYSSRSRSSKTVDWSRERVALTFNDYAPNENKKPFAYVIRDYAVMPESDDWRFNYTCYMDLEFFKELYTQYANTLKLEDRKKAVASLNEFSEIQINVDNMNNVTAVQDEIKKLGYGSSSDMQYIEPMQETSQMLQFVLGAIGVVAMLVSAINIANTMIMATYERTKEIGIMKVLGCIVGDIRKLFLFEAGLLGFFGGIIGLGISFAGVHLINKYGGPIFEKLSSGSIFFGNGEEGGFLVIPIWLPIFAVAIGMAVGLVSGFIPAYRATTIRAIEAMKTEG